MQKIDTTKPFSVQMKAEENRSIAITYNPEINIFHLKTVNPSKTIEGEMVEQSIFLAAQEFNCIFPLFDQMKPHLLETEYAIITKKQIKANPPKKTNSEG